MIFYGIVYALLENDMRRILAYSIVNQVGFMVTAIGIVFFQTDSGLRAADPPLAMRLAMLLFAALCVGLGVFSAPLYAVLPYLATYVAYTGAHVVGQLQLLLFSGLAFFVMLGALKRTRTITLDVDWIYRRAGPALVAAAGSALGGLNAASARVARAAVRGLMARTRATGGMALWMAALRAAYLLVYDL